MVKVPWNPNQTQLGVYFHLVCSCTMAIIWASRLGHHWSQPLMLNHCHANSDLSLCTVNPGPTDGDARVHCIPWKSTPLAALSDWPTSPLVAVGAFADSFPTLLSRNRIRLGASVWILLLSYIDFFLFFLNFRFWSRVCRLYSSSQPCTVALAWSSLVVGHPDLVGASLADLSVLFDG